MSNFYTQNQISIFNKNKEFELLPRITKNSFLVDLWF